MTSRARALHPHRLATFALLWTVTARAADPAAGSDVFVLGEIEVSGAADRSPAAPAFGAATISEETMEKNVAVDVGQALAHVTGVSPTMTGQRNETQVFIRGFNQNQITLNIDGIPIYVPYDGNVDLSRLLTANYSQIVVTKGLGSLMYGPNNLGGTINLVTKRPDKPFSADIGGGIVANQEDLFGSSGSVQLGTRINNLWYATAGMAINTSSSFPLSGSFAAVPAQPSGERAHDASHADNGNVKIGFTPNASDEYAIGVSTVSSTKQDPPYTGNTTVTGQRVAYWDWPQWDKHSYYFIGNTGIGSGFLKTRVYLDQFINQLYSYDTASYDTTFRPYAFLSKYDDHSSGANVEYDQPIAQAHLLKIAAFYKNDIHTETQFADDAKHYDSPWLHFQAHTASLGLEDTWSLTRATELVAGYRHDHHEFDQAQVYTSNLASSAPLDAVVVSQPRGGANNANNWQLTAQHDLGADPGTGGPVLRAGIGRKTRFPGIKDVYSYSLGKSIANPGLGPEQALNREIGVSGRVGTASYDAALYWDTISSAIEAVSIAPGLTQNQNVGTATNKGLDLSLNLPLIAAWRATLLYSHLDRSLGASGLVATGTPGNRGEVDLSWLPLDSLELVADVQANSSIQTATNSLQPVAGSAVADLHVTGHLTKRLTVNGGIYNVFDRNYALVEGFPMPGRTLKLALNYHM